jgi:Domain of unknown function (DUF4352)
MSVLAGGTGRAKGSSRRQLVFAVVVLAAAVLASVLGGGASAVASSAPFVPSQVQRADGKIGEPVRDGKFEFTVRSVKCGVSQVGEEPLTKPAQGQFCLVTVTVKNIGDRSQTLSDSDQKGIGADGKQFQTDTTAGLYANSNADVFLNDINPGNQVTGVLVYDIPKDGKLAKLELHDSPFSGGATVQVS